MRWAIGIEYDGAAFNGWQSQAHAVGVQAAVEAALTAVADEPIKVQCAGRTDAGVHAVGQVAHFDTARIRTPRAWTLGANTHLPRGVALRWAMEVPQGFHARFSALSRRYAYLILNRPTRAGLWQARMAWEFRPLEVSLMQQAAQALIGQHDFSSFRAAGCQSRHPLRTVHALRISRTEDLVRIDIEANAFLQHMVRNIAGVLLEIGAGGRPPEWAGEVLAARDRRCGGVTAPACGLYFLEARYPAEFALPAAAVPDVGLPW